MSLGRKLLPAALELIHKLRHRRIFHILEAKPVRLKWAMAAHIVGDLVRLGAGAVEGSIGKEVARPDEAPSAIWNPAAITRGGPSKRDGVASANETGISGPRCEPRIHPSTRCGKVKGSSTSPTAGMPDWQRTIITGSSLPTYFPAIRLSLSVDAAAAISPSERRKTRLIM